MDYQQEERQFFGGSMVKMPMGDFVREHHHLINVLQHGSRKTQRAEAKSQAKELAERMRRKRR
jgi:fructose-specific phosphotransferase system component IIB